jgi:nucleoside-diphosphate-sugar epimerase
MNSSTTETILISGASGWLGKETISLISRNMIPNLTSNNLHLFSSDGRSIELTEGSKFPTSSFLGNQDSLPIGSVEGFINLAFLTRDKVKLMDSKNYLKINLDLISKACKIIVINRPKWIVLVSSGAILDRQSGQLENDVDKNPYGFCKRIEELLLQDAAKSVGANIVIGRLWGATGAEMPPSNEYAVSDFIESARLKGKIHIRSGGQVFRRYVDAGQFMEVLIKLAKAGESITLNSGGDLVELGELRDLVATFFPNIKLSRSSEPGPVDDYYPKGDSFEDHARILGVKLSPMMEQVGRTVKGHLLQSMN